MKKFILGIILLFSMTGCEKTRIEKEIISSYGSPLKFEWLNSDLILATNSSKEINIYNVKEKNFILKKWYDGDISGFGITFYEDFDNGVYTGILVTPEEYSKLLKYRDDLVQGEDPENQSKLNEAVKEYGEVSKKLKSTEAIVCKNCPGKSCTRCFGRGWYQGHDSSKDDPNEYKMIYGTDKPKN